MEALTAGGGGEGGARSGEVKVRGGSCQMMACVSGASEKGIVCVALGADARRGAGVRAAIVRPVRPLGAAAASLGVRGGGERRAAARRHTEGGEDGRGGEGRATSPQQCGQQRRGVAARRIAPALI